MNRLFPNVLAIALFLMVPYAAFAQGGQRMMQRKGESHKSGSRACPRAYIGFSTGINNPVGILGPQVDIAVTPEFSLGSGVGLSSWGYKVFFEGRYYFKPCNRGWAVAAGITHNTGGNGLELQEQETIYGKGTVVVNLKAQTNFMISGYHFFNLGRQQRHRFHLQFGYSLPLTAPDFRQVAGAPLTNSGKNNGTDNILAIAPGGLILGVGFSFGAGRM